MRALLLVSLCLGLVACSNDSTSVEDYDARSVTLPDGSLVKAEVMMNPTDMARGMMFRDKFPEGRGMLFIHGSEDNHRYFMYQVKIPLDMVWMDKNRRVVEMAENVPPCKTAKASECRPTGANGNPCSCWSYPRGMGASTASEKVQFCSSKLAWIANN
jgi:uncharacterized membrane protein (UPF0127 family)